MAKVKKPSSSIRINRIGAVLADKGKTNKDLETHFGAAQSTVSNWVTNKSQPSVYHFWEIAKYLQCDIRDLFVPTPQFIK
ncbi:Cro/C1-type helix-turn-helix DNA-binding protein [Chitinophaga dinghuensis]|uniref:Cro/C1-type helix-turn-helix DNA-binding protein n=1 Tax=Chitinophaga dinghuensis TaxID=1539050 RepID=A0A327VYT3_9BACT|nr:helix-turn-helix transcriptional regulator [Chitinophaga dinghuensis]RAJ80106.1 Cro/C1-type helix-turn-helix DNA-binding protein [Chitinophaga dinghuensis]